MRRRARSEERLEVLLSALGGDRQVLAELIGIFRDGVAARLPELTLAVARKDAPAVLRLAHGLRGSVANFSTGAAYLAAEQLEQLARQGDLARAPRELRRLRLGLTRLLGAMRQFEGAGAATPT